MSTAKSPYPERVFSSGGEERWRQLAERVGSAGVSKGLLLGGLIGFGLGAWMVWHFGPDIVRYIKMEKM